MAAGGSKERQLLTGLKSALDKPALTELFQLPLIYHDHTYHPCHHIVDAFKKRLGGKTECLAQF